MLYLLNAINTQKQTFWLLFCLGLLLIIEIAAYAIFLVFNSKRTQSEQRSVVGIRLNTKNVQRKFTVGDDFDCNGLFVTAIYNLEPTSVNLDYVVVTDVQFEGLKSQSEIEGCYVIMPDMSTAGSKSVAVHYHDKIARFSISVVEKEPATKSSTEPVDEPVKPMVKLKAKLSQAFGTIKSVFVKAEPENTVQTVEEPATEPTDEPTDKPMAKLKAKLSQFFAKIKSVFVKTKPQADLSLDNPERSLVSFSLDTVVVKHTFVLGEPFSCDGLVVYANYNATPTHESIVDYKILNQDQFNHMKTAAEATLYIIQPDMSEIGIKIVNVVYGGITESYTIEVVEPNSVAPTNTEN